jgi:hypothetical protein
MFPEVTTKNPAAVEMAVQSAYLTLFPKGDRFFVPRIFGWASDCFHGRFGNYQPIDTRYHDFEHTLQGTLCMARLLVHRQAAGATPVMGPRLVELGLLAILLHDTGYLKTVEDTEGTGAKYTTIHVQRSVEFTGRLLADKMFLPREIVSVQNMIRCTGLDAVLNLIPFQSEMEQVMGHVLGTADLLGQMAADDYVEKLPILYAEFAEASRFAKQKANYVSIFSSEGDLLAKTPIFWENYVKPKLDRELGGLHRFLNNPYPEGPNWYLDRIENNIEKLRRLLAGETAKFLRNRPTYVLA